MTELCIAPHEIQEGDLMAYVDGQATSLVTDHVRRCPHCWSEAAMLAETMGQVESLLHRPDCPPAETLLLYETDLLPAPERTPVHAHVQHCRLCQSDLAELAAVSYAPPRTPWYERLLHEGRTLLEFLRLPAPPPPAWGTRGQSSTAPQVGQYQAGPYHVTIQSSEESFRPDGLYVEGWLSQPGASYPLPPVRVVLLQGETSQRTDEVDEGGYFILEKVPPGRYHLQLEFPSHIAVIQDIELPIA